MKTIKIILLVTLCFQLQQASAQTSYDITGNWVVDADKTFDSMGVQQKTKYNNMPQEKQQHIYELFENRTFRFYGDSLVQVRFQTDSVQKINGTYYYNSANRKLSINVKGTITQYNVEWLAQNKLKLVFLTASPQGLLNSLYLVLNN